MPANVVELCWGSADIILGLSALPSAAAVQFPFPKLLWVYLRKVQLLFP